MGRTLHFGVLNAEQITEAEKEKIFAISEKLNSGEFKKVWSCENFYLDPYDYYPNWVYWENFHPKTVGQTAIWQAVEKILKEHMRQGTPRFKVLKEMRQVGFIKFHGESLKEIRGFCKVGGNEFNAQLVYIGILQISLATRAIIRISDEGEFLLAPLIVKNGLATLDIAKMHENIKYWREKNEVYKSCWEDFEERARNFEKLMRRYGSTLRTPDLFCRKINSDDFKNHPEYGAGQIMAGFHGEYFGLAKDDAEKKSYEFSAMIQKIFGGLGAKIEVAPKI